MYILGINPALYFLSICHLKRRKLLAVSAADKKTFNYIHPRSLPNPFSNFHSSLHAIDYTLNPAATDLNYQKLSQLHSVLRQMLQAFPGVALTPWSINLFCRIKIINQK